VTSRQRRRTLHKKWIVRRKRSRQPARRAVERGEGRSEERGALGTRMNTSAPAATGSGWRPPKAVGSLPERGRAW
jgi:hypothetical protein